MRGKLALVITNPNPKQMKNRARSKSRSSQSYLQELQIYLQNSEWTLIQFMVSNHVWIGNVPQPPSGYDPTDSNVDLGLAAYWLNNPDSLHFPPDVIKEIKKIIEEWKKHDASTFPQTLMTLDNYNFINSPRNHMIYTDGSVLTAETYATYDQNWFLAFLNLLETNFHDAWKYGEIFDRIQFNNQPITISGQNPNQVRIAILGDWGTGNAVSQDVMNQVTASNPDYIIHVGDVYYSGTPSLGSTHGSLYFNPGEELQKLVNAWPARYAGNSFTLNSNHEMYAGGNGYFDDALSASGPFSAQNGQSAFALQFNDWTILGLDTAWFGSSEDAFMTGSIQTALESQQLDWIQGLGLDPQKTILLTHHNGFADDCSAVSSLWAQINNALGGDPYAWYWGHVHNGIVYNSPMQIPASSFRTNTYARCLGHAALPYGNAVSLNGKPITWRETHQQPGNFELYNGYAIITLRANGNQVTGISESFYNLSGTSAAYSGVIFSATGQSKTKSADKKK